MTRKVPRDHMRIKKLNTKELLSLMKIIKEVRPISRRSTLISHLDDQACEGLCEMLHNIVENKKVPEESRKKLLHVLKPYKKEVRYLTNAKITNRSLKKRRLSQMGGFVLSTILGVAIPLLTSLLFKRK